MRLPLLLLILLCALAAPLHSQTVPACVVTNAPTTARGKVVTCSLVGGLRLAVGDTLVLKAAAAPAPPDVLTFAQRTADGALVIAPPGHLTFTVGSTSCVYVIRRTVSGSLVTGRTVTLSIADTGIAKLVPPSTDPSCPDTTVDPAKIPEAPESL